MDFVMKNKQIITESAKLWGKKYFFNLFYAIVCVPQTKQR
jgi:hypothetical protein